MEEKKLNRALTWVGGGGSALAVTALMTAGLFAATPDGRSPMSDLIPCFAPGCSSKLSPAATTTASARTTATRPAHSGRVTRPETRGINEQSKSKPGSSAKAKAKAKAKATGKGKGKAGTATPATQADQEWTTTLPEQHLAAPIVGMAPVNNGSLVLAGSDGGVFPVGQAGYYGSLAGRSLGHGIAGLTSDPATGGYWLAGRDGGVFSLHAGYFGSLAGHKLAAPIVAIAATPTGRGYWMASADGGVFAFGDARYAGSLSRQKLAAPIVAMAASPTGRGYLLASSDGGVFSFGDAPYAGSLGRHKLGSPIVAMAATPTGRGYWMASSDGGVFSFGDARYLGGDTAQGPAAAISSFVPTHSGRGYWMAGQGGQVLAYGDARPVRQTAPAVEVNAVGLGRAGLKTVESRITRYRPGASGFDISQYQCGSIPSHWAEVSVVQVTGGALDNPPNSCFRAEAKWAGINMSAYIYMNGLPSPTPAAALQGPAGTCSAADVICKSYNYGFNYGRYWLAYSHSQGVSPKLWWLDVENYSGWSSPASNSTVIRGTLDALKSAGAATGIYSSQPQWNSITGGMDIHGEPIWVPGAGNPTGPGYTAANFCHDPATYGFGGGRLVMVQFGYMGPFPGTYTGPAVPYDQDFSCH